MVANLAINGTRNWKFNGGNILPKPVSLYSILYYYTLVTSLDVCEKCRLLNSFELFMVLLIIHHHMTRHFKVRES